MRYLSRYLAVGCLQGSPLTLSQRKWSIYVGSLVVMTECPVIDNRGFGRGKYSICESKAVRGSCRIIKQRVLRSLLKNRRCL